MEGFIPVDPDERSPLDRQYNFPHEWGDVWEEFVRVCTRVPGVTDISCVPVMENDPDYQFKTDKFVTRPYWWNDCTCGFEDEENDWYNSNPHFDTCYQQEYQKLHDKWRGEHTWSNRPQYGTPEYIQREAAEKAEVYELLSKWNLPYYGYAAHCTCGSTERYYEFMRTHGHRLDCKVILPNFHYYPTDFQVEWYKYPFRDAKCNQDIGTRDFLAMMDDCIQTVKTLIPARGRFLVSGRTFDHREAIKALGGRWNPNVKGWIIEGPYPETLAELEGVRIEYDNDDGTRANNADTAGVRQLGESESDGVRYRLKRT